MLPDHFLVRRAVDAVDLVVRHVAVDPLDLRTEVLEDRAAGLRCGLEVGCAKLTHAGHFPLNHELRHDTSRCSLLQRASIAPRARDLRIRPTPSEVRSPRRRHRYLVDPWQ